MKFRVKLKEGLIDDYTGIKFVHRDDHDHDTVYTIRSTSNNRYRIEWIDQKGKTEGVSYDKEQAHMFFRTREWEQVIV